MRSHCASAYAAAWRLPTPTLLLRLLVMRCRFLYAMLLVYAIRRHFVCHARLSLAMLLIRYYAERACDMKISCAACAYAFMRADARALRAA